MGNMASEIERRIREDGGAGLADPSALEGAASGNESVQPPGSAPAAEPSTTETAGREGTPDTIPYARFKEVNDQLGELKGYSQLAELGYDPDSLGRLAAFEARYISDPIGTWRDLANDLDLPQEVVDAMEKHLSDGATPPGPSGGDEPSGDGTPTAALSKEDREAIEYAREMRKREAEREVQAESDRRLGIVTGHWDKLDKEDGITTPEHIKLMHISTAARTGQFATLEELAEFARDQRLADREEILGSTIVPRRGNTGSPLPLSGGAPPAEPRNFGADIKAATKAALADIEAGRLPS